MTSYWIEFGDWPLAVRRRRVPPFPLAAGVTAADEREALDLIRRGFYEPDRELPPVLRVTAGVTVAKREIDGPYHLREEASGKRGIWYPKPLFPDRTETDDGPRRTPYRVLAKAALEDGGIPSRIAHGVAVVLERIADAAGQKNWYLIERRDQFNELMGMLAPGSSVTFFLDGRIQEVDANDDTKASIVAIVGEDGDALVARRTDGIELDVDDLTDPADLAEFMRRLRPGEKILFGRWGIGEDDDGVVTVDMPDRDGTTRRHAY